LTTRESRVEPETYFLRGKEVNVMSGKHAKPIHRVRRVLLSLAVAGALVPAAASAASAQGATVCHANGGGVDQFVYTPSGQVISHETHHENFVGHNCEN
jgi:hypothetical protein